MNERELFTSFWVRESATTRRVLARIPEGSTYRPDAVRADLRARYEQLRRTIRAQVAWGDDAIGDVMAILAHTAYHLGAIRQIARAVVEAP